MYKSFLYNKIDKYILTERTKIKKCQNCIYYKNNMCEFLSKPKDTFFMINNKDLCGPYHKLHKNESTSK